ncbi:hypothetical protein L1987_47769 [Smallanthus sonchifolius]|uniref:Uncharacterized protein n=1 Tax=Smallanthus sonchifolius TaxID=185202 RepID=A0ACB9FPG2_9ASTR|nr:hypothetical protein L1987_47769 [Smallanthus sonchifolius]
MVSAASATFRLTQPSSSPTASLKSKPHITFPFKAYTFSAFNKHPKLQMAAKSTDVSKEDRPSEAETEAFDKRRQEEKFAVLNTGIYECRSCGYLYNEAAGDPSYPIAPGLPFDRFPEDWRCPTCGAAKSFFASKSVEIAGFAQNQQFGLGGNTLTSGQKAILIYGSLLFFFVLFLSDMDSVSISLQLLSALASHDENYRTEIMARAVEVLTRRISCVFHTVRIWCGESACSVYFWVESVHLIVLLNPRESVSANHIKYAESSRHLVSTGSTSSWLNLAELVAAGGAIIPLESQNYMLHEASCGALVKLKKITRKIPTLEQQALKGLVSIELMKLQEGGVSEPSRVVILRNRAAALNALLVLESGYSSSALSMAESDAMEAFLQLFRCHLEKLKLPNWLFFLYAHYFTQDRLLSSNVSTIVA